MANNEDLSRKSQDQMKAFTRAVSDAKNLPQQQEKAVKKVLAGEIKIAEKRQQALENYFEFYSNKLEAINEQQNKFLDNTFSILNQKLAHSYETLSSNISKLEQQMANSSKAASKDNNQKETRKNQNHRKHRQVDQATSENRLKQVSRAQNNRNSSLNNSFNQSQQNNRSQFATTRDANATPNNGQPASNRGVQAANTVETFVEEEPRQALLETSWSDIQNFTEQATSNRKSQLIQEVDLEARYAQIELANLAELANDKEAILTSMWDLELARSKDEKLLTARSTEFRLNKLKDVVDAELAAQNLLNQIDLQLSETNRPEASDPYNGEMQARKLNAEMTSEVARSLEAQIKAFRDSLNFESMMKNGGELDPADATRNEQKVREEFATRKEELLREIKLEQALKQSNAKLAEAREEQKTRRIAELEYRARQKNNGILTRDEEKAIKKQAELEFELNEENLERIEKLRQEQEQEDHNKSKKQRAEAGEAAMDTLFGKGNTIEERLAAYNKLTSDGHGGNPTDGNGNEISKGMANMVIAINAISDIAKQLDNTIDKIASYKGPIDTRLQGSNNKTSLGSYWDQLVKDMMSVGAVTPFFKQEDFAKNIETLVNRGISFDLKQRAFLMTIQEKIATTFDVADGTLLRLIRIQQEDSTAGRLGMESALNSFLNEMYETSEYLSDVAGSVRNSLQEMEALMGGAEATEVEYQVQKWMGSLYSVGMSQEAVQSIASALGQIAAGQVDALTGGGAGNLMVMAANDAGIPISDILANGLNAEQTNKLLQATVNYLAEIAEASNDNRVVQQQLANVFGVKASDIKAATNLAIPGTTSDIYKESLTYDNMLNQLYKMAGSMWTRTSISEMMTNLWDNAQYSIAGSMANNPISYLTFKMADLLEDATGGISLPFLNVYGFGVDLETTVADLMRVASVGTGILGSLGPMISGLASSFSGRGMLKTMGIKEGSGLEITPRGGGGSGVGASDTDGSSNGGGAQTLSSSGYVGNSSGSDVKNSTIQESEDTKDQLMIEAKEEAEATQFDIISMNVLKIYELLDEVANGKRSLSVKVERYGLTSLDNSSLVGNSQAGVAGLLSSTPASNDSLNGGFTSDNGSSSANNGTSSSFGIGSSIDLGGWTML